MNPRYLICVFAWWLLCAVAGGVCVHAAAEGAEGEGWLLTIGRWVNLAILFGVIYYFAGGPIGRFFAARREGIQREMQAADQARVGAERQLAEIEHKMRRLEEEKAAIREGIDREARSERERLMQEAGRESERILILARREIQSLTLSAQKELREQAAHLAVELAEKRILQSMSPDVERRLIEQFFTELGEASLP